MKTILVDALDTLILADGTLFDAMRVLLDSYPNPKLVLTNANDGQWKQFNISISPYEVFTLKHEPDKTDPKYFEILLDQHALQPEDVVYFEHSAKAVKSAESLGIKSYFYDHTKKDLAALKEFLDSPL